MVCTLHLKGWGHQQLLRGNRENPGSLRCSRRLPTAPAFLKALKFSVKAAACLVHPGELSEG